MKKGFFTLLILVLSAVSAQAAPTNSSGPWGIDAGGFKNLSTALASPLTLGRTVVISKIMTINNKTTDRTIEVRKGGLISINVGKAYIQNGPVVAGDFQIIGGSGTFIYGPKGPRTIKPEWRGAIGDNSTDNTTALIRTFSDAGNDRTVLLNGIYAYNSTSGSFGLTAYCPIKGTNPVTDGLHNVGTGSALLLGGGGASTRYYNRWENFSVIGNNSSQDGVVTSSTGTGTATAYSSFSSVDIFGHGRYGLRHRNAYGTKYIDCKFQNNLGAGIILETPGTPPSTSEGFANGVTFINCDSRHNGSTAAQEPSTGSASTATFLADGNGVYHAGVVITSAAGIQWQGGIIENNDAWGVIITPAVSGASVRSVHFSPGYMEVNPASAPVGGNFYASGPWSNITITKSNLFYGGAAVGQTGYNFYITGGEGTAGTNNFKEYDNSNIAPSTYLGTKIFSYGASQTQPKVLVSLPFGDLSGSAVVTTIATLTGTNPIATIYGTITSKRNSDTAGAAYPFVAGQNGTAATYAAIGSAIAGSSTAAPTIAWAGNDLQITTPGYVVASVAVWDTSYNHPSDYSLTYSAVLFGTMMKRE